MSPLRITLLLFVTLFFYSATSTAQSISSSDLIKNCQELISIYEKRDKHNLLAAVVSSHAEAMRAGICRGMIEAHSLHTSCDSGWYIRATQIARGSASNSVEELLIQGCE